MIRTIKGDTYHFNIEKIEQVSRTLPHIFASLQTTIRQVTHLNSALTILPNTSQGNLMTTSTPFSQQVAEQVEIIRQVRDVYVHD
ncbi:MAG: hypothetical protein KJ630_22420 [Proteobacteria bacterium]|nr:hypothetical protein [Pseudomonadota bacterium]